MIFTRTFLLIAVTLVALSSLWSGADPAASAPSQCVSCTAAMVLDDMPDNTGDTTAQGANVSADPADPFVAGFLQAAAPDTRAELAATPPPSYKPAPAHVLL
ncbi:MAG TPA: hypothetical protein VIO81_06005, partial [Methyloversatilis sp.]